MLCFPYVTSFFIFILIVVELYKTKLKKNYCNINDEVDILGMRVKKYLTTHLIHAGSVVGHFIPNVILTLFLGTLLECVVGSVRMLIYILASIFLYWPIVYYFIRTYREGCGFSSIYFSFVSIYFSILVLFENNHLLRLLYTFIPYLFLFLINYIGTNVCKIKKSSNNIHILSIIYGYIVGIIETVIYYWA
jgi:hypothetical protein